MDKRYQVFVSSTYEDLTEERQEVMQALLELDCMPSGMELFPATNDDQWTLIRRVIDDCDYYIVIVAGRYGSIGPTGISYTQMEYEYAIAQGKPVIAFLHKDPTSLTLKKTEKVQESREKLEQFRALIQQKMCKFWLTPTELGSVVSRSLIKLIKTNPAIGWVKGDLVPDESTTEEILKLKRRIEELERDLSEARTQAPLGTEMFAQGDDPVAINYYFSAYKTNYTDTKKYSSTFRSNWDEIFARVSPLMIDEATEDAIRSELNDLIREKTREILRDSKGFKNLRDFNISDDDFQTIKVQLKALNLIAKSHKHRSLKDQATYWTLTPYGDSVMTRLRAIRKVEAVNPSV
jgi:Domain of unknown function (DUF4062)